jgi:uncharacterized protein YqfA (UPF0365 family)
MPITLTDMLGMALRNSPVLKIRKALTKCEAAGLAVTFRDLETHHLCGRDPLVLADVLVSANQLGVSTTFIEMSSIILAGHDPLPLLLDASNDRTIRFDTFSPKRDDRIRGFTRDNQEVLAALTVVYRLSLSQLAFSFDFRHVHERLGAAVSVFINTAPSLRTLQIMRMEHEAELQLLGIDALPGFRSISIEYR